MFASGALAGPFDMASPQDGGVPIAATTNEGRADTLRGTAPPLRKIAWSTNRTSACKSSRLPNVVVKPKNSNLPSKKKKFTLNDMLGHARKVETTMVQPIKELVLESHIDNPFLTEVFEGISQKYSAFSRRHDEAFTKEFSREFSRWRQEAWKRALRHYSKGGHFKLSIISGLKYKLPEEWVIRVPWARDTYIESDLRVNLISGTFNTIECNSIESSEIWSGLKKGNVSLATPFLDYNTKASIKDGRRHIDELQELKMIYAAFWRLSKLNRHNWLSEVYHKPNQRFVACYGPEFLPPDKLVRSWDTVLFVIEGILVETSVEDLFDWIEHYRIPKKKYAIGECENEHAVHFALYLWSLGIPRDTIKTYLTLDCVEEAIAHVSLTLFSIPPKEDEDDDYEAILRMMQPNPNAELGEASQIVEIRPTDIGDDPVRGWDDAIRSFAQECEDDSDSTHTKVSSEGTVDSVEALLARTQDLHLHHNEMVSISMKEFGKNPIVESSSSSEDDGDYIPDSKLTANEKLNIDLVDPGRDIVSQPSLRRIGLVWDPGGRPRDLLMRYAFRRDAARRP